MLAQPYTLPGAQREFAIRNGDCQWAAQEAGLHVRGLQDKQKYVKRLYYR